MRSTYAKECRYFQVNGKLMQLITRNSGANLPTCTGVRILIPRTANVSVSLVDGQINLILELELVLNLVGNEQAGEARTNADDA